LAVVASALAANEAEVLLDAAGLALTAMQVLSSHNRADVDTDTWWLAAKAALADLCPKLSAAHTGTPADLATMVVQLPRVAKARAFSYAQEIRAFIDGVDVVQLLLSVVEYATMGIKERDEDPPGQPAAAARVLAEGSFSLDSLATNFASKHFKAKAGVHTLDSDAGVMDMVQDPVGHLSTALFRGGDVGDVAKAMIRRAHAYDHDLVPHLGLALAGLTSVFDTPSLPVRS
jgi:hypothetical protein